MDLPASVKRETIFNALSVYVEVLKSAKKGEEKAHLPTEEADERIALCEHLKTEYSDHAKQLSVEFGADGGLPFGDLRTAEHFKDDDGTDLQAGALDEWLRNTAHCAVPKEVISAWPLPQRKIVAAWLRAADDNAKKARELNGETGAEADGATVTAVQPSTYAPDFIDLAWFIPADQEAATEAAAANSGEAIELTPEEVDEWVARGPWKVQQENGTKDVWEVIHVDEGNPAVSEPPQHPFTYDLQKAARVAAGLNQKAAGEAAPAAE